MRRNYLLLYFLIFSAILHSVLLSQENGRISSRLLTAIQKEPPNTELTAWVFFTDKGSALSKSLASAEASLTPHAYQRRLRTRGDNNLVESCRIYADDDSTAHSAMDYYIVLARFKMAIVLEQGYARFVQGKADNPKMEAFGDVVLEMAARAAELCRTTKL